MDIMTTTLDSGHSLVEPKQEPQEVVSSRPASPTTSDNIGTNSNVEEEEVVEKETTTAAAETSLNGCASEDPSPNTTTSENDDGGIPPMKLHVTLSVSGKKQYRKRKSKLTFEDLEFSSLLKNKKRKKFSFVAKEKVTTRATTPSERLFCRKCNIQLFSYRLFECHTIDHALKSPVSVCIEQLHLLPEVVEEAVAYAKRQSERAAKELEATNNRIAETIESVISSELLSAEEETRIGNDESSEIETKKQESVGGYDIVAATTKDTTKDIDSSFEANSSFNQSLEQFQTDMIEELHKQIRRLSEASSTYEEDKSDVTKDATTMLSTAENNATVKDSVIVTNPGGSRSVPTVQVDGGNPYERYCPSVAIIEKESNVVAATTSQQRFPAPSVLSAILSSSTRPPPPPLQSMARMAFSQPPTTHNTLLTQSTPLTKPFGQHQFDNSRPASVIYVDTVRSQLPSIESVVSLAPGYKQPPHYSNITFPAASGGGGGGGSGNTGSDGMPNNVVHDPTAHVTSGGSSCTCVSCKDLLEGSLLRQAKIFLPGGFVEFFCPICKRKFQRKSSLWRHCRTANHGYICNMCGSGFLKQDMFDQHRQLHVARLNSQSSTNVPNAPPGSSAQQPQPPSATTTMMPNASSSQEHPARRPVQPHPQLTARLNAANSSISAAAVSGSSKDDDVIVVAVGKRTTPPVTQNTAVRGAANHSFLSGNARQQKEGMVAKVSSPAKPNVPQPSQNINRILKSNEITLTPIRSLQSSFGEGGNCRTAVRMPPPPPLQHSAQVQPRPPGLRAQGPPQNRFEGSLSYSQQRPSLQQQQSNIAANNMAANIRMSLMRTARPNQAVVSTMSQVSQMNTTSAAAFTMTHAQNVRGQLIGSSGNRMPQLHPNQMVNSSRMAQPGGVRMPVWHHPVPTSTGVVQRPQFARPPQLVPVSLGVRMPMTTQAMATMTRPLQTSVMKPSMAQLASSMAQRRPVHPGHIVPTNPAQNVSRPATTSTQSATMQQRFTRPPYFRTPMPFTRPAPGSVEDMTLKCVHCDAKFSNQTALQVHFSEIHAAVLSCRRCSAKFRSILTLKRHEAVCIEKVRCLKCKQVMHHDQLIAHITEVHYPKGNDGTSTATQQTQSLPCSSTAATTCSYTLIPSTHPSVNVSWTNVTHNAGMILSHESQSMPQGGVVNTMAVRTPVISSVVSLSRTSPLACSLDVSEHQSSNPSGIDINTVINSAETPIVIEDDPVSSVLSTTAAKNDVLPTVTDTSEVLPTVTDNSDVLPNENTNEVLPTVTDCSDVLPTVTDSSDALPTVTDSSDALPTVTDSSDALPTVTDSSDVFPTVTDSSDVSPTVTDSSDVFPTVTDSSDVSPTVTDSSAVSATESVTNEQEPTLPRGTEGSTSTDRPPNEELDNDESMEVAGGMSVEEKLVESSMELPNEAMPLIEAESLDESVCKVPSTEGNDDEPRTVTPPQMNHNLVIENVLSGVEITGEDVDEDDSAVDLPIDTPSPSVGSASSPEPPVTPRSSEKRFTCPICDKQVYTNDDFLEHIQIHKSDEIYDCALCDKAFSSKRLLVLHLRSHMRSCSKRIGTSPDAKRRKSTGPSLPLAPTLDGPSVQSEGRGERLVVALFDMEKVASSLSVLRNMGVVGLMSIEDFALYLSRKTAMGAEVSNEELPVTRLQHCADSTVMMQEDSTLES